VWCKEWTDGDMDELGGILICYPSSTKHHPCHGPTCACQTINLDTLTRSTRLAQVFDGQQDCLV